jgi:Tn3 transposase DDE domain
LTGPDAASSNSSTVRFTVVLWNTRYIDLTVNVLRGQGYPVRDEDAARLSPLRHAHVNMLGRYTFPAPSAERKLRPLRDHDSPAF